MLTVHGRATSLNVQAVMWTAAELGLAVDRRDEGLNFGGNDTPDYLAMNPNGLVPTLQDEHVTLFESAAIVRYLAARHGRFPFWPEDPVARAPVDMWAEWAKTTLARDFTGPIFWAMIWTSGADRDLPRLEKALATFDEDLAILEAQLGDNPYVTGRDFTLADIVVGHLLYRYFTLDIPRRDRPVIAAYYDRLCARPAYAEHVMVSYEPLRVPGA